MAVRRIVPIPVLLACMACLAGAGSDGVLAAGARGGIVEVLQAWLTESGFLTPVTGSFGALTETSVRAFQQATGLAEDGVVGPQTWSALGRSALYKGDEPPLTSRGAAAPLLDWETVNAIWPPRAAAWITDVERRTTMKVIRLGGHLHADVEPATSADTAILKSWYGSWSWSRRAVVFRYGRICCGASINGMPHGRDTVSNGFPGQFCLHFLGSRVHQDGQMDADHQRMVMRAARALLEPAWLDPRE